MGNYIFNSQQLSEAFNENVSTIGPKLASESNIKSHLIYLTSTDKKFET